MIDPERIGSFLLYQKPIPKERTLYTLKYAPEHFPIMEYQFLDKAKAVDFAEKKTKSDKKLFKYEE